MRIEYPESNMQNVIKNDELLRAVIRCAESLELIAEKILDDKGTSLKTDEPEGSDNA